MSKKYVLQKLAQLVDELQTKEVRNDYINLKLHFSNDLKNELVKKYKIK